MCSRVDCNPEDYPIDQDCDKGVKLQLHVSVVIPTKNGGSLLGRVVQEVLNQETDFTFDLTLIDSGSSDGVVEELEALEEKRLKIIRIPAETFGHGRTRNEAIAASNGRYIAMLTQDALPTNKNWLTNLVEEIDSDERLAGVFGRHIAYPEADLFTMRDLEKHFDSFKNKKLEDASVALNKSGYSPNYFFSDNNAMIRRTVWEEIPYPEVSYAEDQQWAKLVLQAGWKKGFSDKGAVFHSHNYSIADLFRRSLDESRAMKKYFGFQTLPHLPRVFRNWLGLSFRDIQYLFSQRNLNGKQFLQLAKRVVGNLVKQLGLYLGGRTSMKSDGLSRLFSYDHRMRVGLRKEKQND